MVDPITFFQLAMQYLILPALGAIWYLYRSHNAVMTRMAVIEAQNAARDQARKEEREAFGKQLDQILLAIQALNTRIDSIMKER